MPHRLRTLDINTILKLHVAAALAIAFHGNAGGKAGGKNNEGKY